MNAPVYRPDDFVKRYFEIKRYIEEQEKAFDERIKPYRDAIGTIKNALLDHLNTNGANSLNTDFGTPYKSVILKPKVVDKPTFVKCSVDNWATVGEQLMNVTAAKEGVAEWMATHGDHPPPGVAVEFFTNLNIRGS